MKKSKLVTFSVRGKAVEQIEGDGIDLDGVECMKTSLAIIHGVSFEEVEVVSKDVFEPELSPFLTVNDEGVLLFKANNLAVFVPVRSVRPAMDINHEELFYEFLDLIQKKDFNGALIFTK